MATVKKREAKSDGFCNLNFYFWTVLGHGSLEKYTLSSKLRTFSEYQTLLKDDETVSNDSFWMMKYKVYSATYILYTLEFVFLEYDMLWGIWYNMIWYSCYEGETFDVDTKEILNNYPFQVW